MTEVIYRRNTCRGCGSASLELVFSLQPSPIGDAYVTEDQLDVPQPTYPIDLYLCSDCGLAQILDVISPSVLYGDYIYLTGSSVGLEEHFQKYATSVLDRCALAPGSLVVDIGSNDGTLLRPFADAGMKVLGIEPATHIASIANDHGIRTIADFLTPSLADSIVAGDGPASLITSNNVFANIDDLDSWVVAVEKLLDRDGVYVFESFYLADVVRNMVFDFIYHEHLSAFSVKPIKRLFERHGLELAAVEHVPTKGGSLRYFVQRSNGPIAPDGSVDDLIQSEEELGLYSKAMYDDFRARVDRLKTETRDFLIAAKEAGKSVAGFGASITGTTLIYDFEIGDYLDFLVDDNPAKQGRYSPGLHLPVYPTAVLYDRKPDYVLVLAWRFAEPFLRKHQAYVDAGGQVAIPVPEFKMVGGEVRAFDASE